MKEHPISHGDRLKDLARAFLYISCFSLILMNFSPSAKAAKGADDPGGETPIPTAGTEASVRMLSYTCNASCDGCTPNPSTQSGQIPYQAGLSEVILDGSYSCEKASAKLSISCSGDVVGAGSFTVCKEPKCGDGVVDAQGTFKGTEQCDDGNTEDGDGCSSQCQFEPVVCTGVYKDGACSNSQCQQKIILKAHGQIKECYYCSDPISGPCGSIGPGVEVQESDSMTCEGNCKTRINNPGPEQFICDHPVPPSIPGGGTVEITERPPQVSSVFCCTWATLQSCTPQICTETNSGQDLGAYCRDMVDCTNGIAQTLVSCDCDANECPPEVQSGK